MASDEVTATKLDIVGVGLAGSRRMTFGVGTLATGTIELDTGLSRVHSIFFTQVSNVDATTSVSFAVAENLPCAGSVVTVVASLLDEGATDAGDIDNASTEQFCWFAIGV